MSLYGRRAQRGELQHLYPPGPHRGLFNRERLNPPEIILCEAVFDALTFYAAGLRNVTCLFGTEGFTDELWEAVEKVRRVRIAYDADDAGDRAAQRDAERFQAARHRSLSRAVPARHGRQRIRLQSQARRQIAGPALELGRMAGQGAAAPQAPPRRRSIWQWSWTN